MKWVRKGRIFAPADHAEWACTHAQVPTALVLPDRVRIFYSDRFAAEGTEPAKSYTTYLDLDRRDPGKVVYYHKEPILPFGAPGTFDDDGVMPSFAIRHEDGVWLYYSGWNRGVTVPYRNSVGIAVSDDDGDTFRRLFEGPVLERTPQEPYIAVTPTHSQGGIDLWRMWYISGTRWVEVEGRYEPVYVIKYAHSQDGIDWIRPNHLCVPQRPRRGGVLPSHGHQATATNTACGTATEIPRDYRDGAGAYRIGYAESADGLAWTRMDDLVGLPVSSARLGLDDDVLSICASVRRSNGDVLQRKWLWPHRLRLCGAGGSMMTGHHAPDEATTA